MCTFHRLERCFLYYMHSQCRTNKIFLFHRTTCIKIQLQIRFKIIIVRTNNIQMATAPLQPYYMTCIYEHGSRFKRFKRFCVVTIYM